jgi:hypothetical protein
MNKTSKGFAAFIILIMAISSLSLIMFKPVNAQSIPKPSVPEFSLKYADYSYNVPPTYGINDYTGQKTTITNGYDVINRTVQFTIKNQPFNAYVDSSGNTIMLYYHIRYKGNYGNTCSDISVKEGNSIIFHDTLIFPASNSSTSEVKVGEYSYGGSGPIGNQRLYNINLPTEGKIDFQVQALIGKAQLFNSNGVLGYFALYSYNFTGQVGDWSSSQTLAFEETSVSPETPNPTVPNTSYFPTIAPSNSNRSIQITIQISTANVILLVGIVLVVILAVVIVVFFSVRPRKTAK